MIDLTSYYNAAKAFDRSIQQMRDDYEYLKKSGKVSTAFLSKQKQLIKNLEFNQNVVEEEIFRMNDTCKSYLEKSKDLKLKAESIFIIYGVMNFPSLMNMSSSVLKDLAITNYKNNYYSLPTGIRNGWSKLPTEDRIALEDILSRALDRKINNEIEEFNHQCQKRKQQIQNNKRKNIISSKSKTI